MKSITYFRSRDYPEMHPLDDTIAAVASPPGGAARGIVRVSGPDAFPSVARYFRGEETAPLAEPPSPRAAGGMLHLPELASPLPCEVYCWPDGRSYTGQPVVEIHTLGSPPLLQVVLRSLTAAGARLAGPGEFTLRAFLGGRIDLSQAEAVLGVIDAADRRELDVALRQLAGGLARPLHALREALLDLLSHLEAGFDFADEEIPFIARDELLARLDEAARQIAAALAQMASRGESVELENAVLVGRPNVGKSSLFNALAADAAALVADLPGTTRDYLVAEIELDGVKCRLIDTAGTRGKENREERRGKREERGEVELPLAVLQEIDSAAQSFAAERSRQAAIRMLCLDSTRPPDDWEREQARNAAERTIVVLTKCDLGGDTRLDFRALPTSSRTGAGIDRLRGELRRKILAARAGAADVVADTAVRCRESLRLAGLSIERARRVAEAGQDELAAAEIRLALEELGKVVGAVYTDDVLDRIFSRFCVGK